MLALKKGRVAKILGTRPGLTEIAVSLGDHETAIATGAQPAKAYNYDLLTGPVKVGNLYTMVQAE